MRKYLPDFAAGIFCYRTGNHVSSDINEYHIHSHGEYNITNIPAVAVPVPTVAPITVASARRGEQFTRMQATRVKQTRKRKIREFQNLSIVSTQGEIRTFYRQIFQ